VKLSCHSCGAVIAGPDVDLVRGVGVCRACGELVPIPSLQASVELAREAELFRPAELAWDERDDERGALSIRLPHRRSSGIPLLLFALVWDGFLVFWYALALKSGHVLMMLFPLVHVFAGIYVTWTALRALLNTVRITMGPDDVRIREGPIFVPRAKFDAPLSAIESFAPTQSHGNRGAIRHGLEVRTRDGVARRVAGRFEQASHAAFASARLNVLLARVKDASNSGLIPYRS